uniref:Uncharacterized protein n=1 Tax=Arundo donax TaxID=35708 RepID=A0A0A9H2L3_ARUDO
MMIDLLPLFDNYIMHIVVGD